MRKQLIATVEALLAEDERIILLLGDIGVFGFRNAFAKYPRRVFNIGILEQSSVGLAAGLAKEGFIPIFHSIAPFVVERAFEQIKIDFGYQNLGGLFVTVGASYDYAALGCTHHCPGDVALMKTVPNMHVIVPGSRHELDQLCRQSYADGMPKYLRLSEFSHRHQITPEFGKAVVIRRGSEGTVVVVGPLLDAVVDATAKMDLTILYYTTVAPFDHATLAENCSTGKVAVVEPFYEGTLAYDIQRSLAGAPCSILYVGVPRRFLTAYGKAEQHDELCGLTSGQIREKLQSFYATQSN